MSERSGNSTPQACYPASGIGDARQRVGPVVHQLPMNYNRWVAAATLRCVPDAGPPLWASFGADLASVRRELRHLQAGRCLYCDAEMLGAVHVDHFLPWARYPDDGMHNLVAAHPGCNTLPKSDALAAAERVETWSGRFRNPEVGFRLEQAPGTAAGRRTRSGP